MFNRSHKQGWLNDNDLGEIKTAQTKNMIFEMIMDYGIQLTTAFHLVGTESLNIELPRE